MIGQDLMPATQPTDALTYVNPAKHIMHLLSEPLCTYLSAPEKNVREICMIDKDKPHLCI